MRLIDADRLKSEKYNEYGADALTDKELYKLIDEQPTIEQGWTPCSERLSEDGQTVLITLKGVGEHVVVTRTYWEVYKKSVWQGHAVIAWMPLPKPYEVEL